MATATTMLSTADANQLNTLRVELKQWEKAFADANGGRKAGRHDIKQDPSIAAKYKTYGRLRALEESSTSTHHAGGQDKTPSKPSNRETRTKRKHADIAHDDTETNNHYTPRKARREIITPSKNNINPNHPATLDPYDSPSVFRRLFSPSTHRQRNNHLRFPSKPPLGLHRNAMAKSWTPSRRKTGQKLDNISESADNEGDKEDNEYENTIGMGRTPASSSKRLYLERLFATPTTLRFATMMENEKDNQPQRILYQKAVTEAQTDEKDALASGTPSFLRRSNSGRYVSSNDNDSANPLSPVGVRKHQRYNGKGLTALVQGLRDMENERMDDDWDILNEIEAEQNGTAGENVQVGDSQVPHDATGEDPNGGRVWKKKGQKRTTRLVKMKPVMQVKNKPSRTTTANASKSTEQRQDEESEESEDELQPKSPGADEDSLPRTRTLRERKQTTEDNLNEDDANEEEDDYNDIDSDNNSDDLDFTETASAKQALPTTMVKPMSSFSEKLKAAFSSVKPLKKKAVAEKDEDKPKPSSPKKRKVNPDAHANYRSLKIRSKGQGRFGRGRFGRR
uniref:DNA replication regulator SLD2 n=1 Tax=Talaromyces marneffei PM1 TaxID=1077442 RepID=A0A093VHH7_TALMA